MTHTQGKPARTPTGLPSPLVTKTMRYYMFFETLFFHFGELPISAAKQSESRKAPTERLAVGVWCRRIERGFVSHLAPSSLCCQVGALL